MVWVALLIILIFAVTGYRAGVVRRALEAVGVIATILVASRLASGFVPVVKERTGLEETPALIIIWIILLVIGFVLTRFVSWLISKSIRVSLLGWLDRWGGAVSGAAIGTLLVSALVIGVSQVPAGEPVRDQFMASSTGRFIYGAAPAVYTEGRRLISGEPDEIWERFFETVKREAASARQKAEEAARELATEERD